MRDMSKVRSFRKAALAIEKFDFKIQHSNQLKGVCPAATISPLIGQVAESPSVP